MCTGQIIDFPSAAAANRFQAGQCGSLAAGLRLEFCEALRRIAADAVFDAMAEVRAVDDVFTVGHGNINRVESTPPGRAALRKCGRSRRLYEQSSLAMVDPPAMSLARDLVGGASAGGAIDRSPRSAISSRPCSLTYRPDNRDAKESLRPVKPASLRERRLPNFAQDLCAIPVAIKKSQ